MPSRMHRRTDRRNAVAVAVAVLALAGAACSPSGSGSTTAPATSPAADGVAAPAATPAAAPVRRSTGCGHPPAVASTTEPPGDVAVPFEHGGLARSYRLGVPPGYDPTRPLGLILNLHGSGGSALDHSTTTRAPVRAGERGYLTVTPDAVDRNWELGPTGRDREFLTALMDDVERSYCVDRDRVHAMGMSLGSWKAALTACLEPDRYASAALVTVEVRPQDCPPLAVVAFHGTADRIVPYGEGAEPGIVVQGANAALPGAGTNMAAWARSAGCSEQGVEKPIGDDVVHRAYPDCDDARHVELYTVLRGDHTWPGGGSGEPPFTTRTIDATAIALDWFAAHPRRP